MSHILDELLAQAANGSPLTAAFSSEDVAVLLFASKFLEERRNWLDREFDPLDEVTDADWDTIEKLVGNVYDAIMNPLIGLVFPIITGTVPTNCLLCDGGSYARTDYPVLYETLDAAFIVDADTFIVPDIQSRVVLGAGTGSGLSTYSVAQQGGEEAHSLNGSENGSHQHGIFTTNGLAIAPGELPVKVPSLVALDTTDLSGSGAAHENRQPFIALNWAVIAQ
jgi:microcystin-dependent protein